MIKKNWFYGRIVIGFLAILCLIGYVIYALFGRGDFLIYETMLIIWLLCALTGSGPGQG